MLFAFGASPKAKSAEQVMLALACQLQSKSAMLVIGKAALGWCPSYFISRSMPQWMQHVTPVKPLLALAWHTSVVDMNRTSVDKVERLLTMDEFCQTLCCQQTERTDSVDLSSHVSLFDEESESVGLICCQF